MTVDLAALAKLASEATPGPWHSGSMIDPKQVYRYSPPNLIPDTEADAAYIAAASPDVVLALVRVALAAKEVADNEEDTHPFMERWNALRAALADLDR